MTTPFSLLPQVALSVRQPWAHALALGWKDIENRAWRKPNPGLAFRGAFCIHASQGMTKREYDAARDFIEGLGFPCPAAADLPRGCIVGQAIVTDIVKVSVSPWFFGPRGLVIENAEPLSPIPCAGALGFFDWRDRLQAGEGCPPAKWMLARQGDDQARECVVDDGARECGQGWLL